MFQIKKLTEKKKEKLKFCDLFHSTIQTNETQSRSD